MTIDNYDADAYGSASAYADLPSNMRSYSYSASAHDDTGVGESESYSRTPGYTGDFAAYTGVDCSHYVTATASVTAYGSNQATGYATATADAYMSY